MEAQDVLKKKTRRCIQVLLSFFAWNILLSTVNFFKMRYKPKWARHVHQKRVQWKSLQRYIPSLVRPIQQGLLKTIIKNIIIYGLGLYSRGFISILLKPKQDTSARKNRFGSAGIDGDKTLSRDSVTKHKPLVNHVITDL